MLTGVILTMGCLVVLRVASILPVTGFMVASLIIQANAAPNAVNQDVIRNFGIDSTWKFRYTLGLLVFVLPVVSLVFKASTCYAQLLFKLRREHGAGKRLLEGVLHRLCSYFLNAYGPFVHPVLLEVR